MKIKRKKRHKIKMTALDFSKPLDLTQFGTEADPCFGKHHSPDAKECGVCGDAPVCAIICSQVQHLKRAEIHSKQSFMDIEEQDTIKLPLIEKFCIEELKKEPDRRLTLQNITVKLEKRFDPKKQLKDKTLGSLLRLVVSKNNRLTFVKTTKNRYLKLK